MAINYLSQVDNDSFSNAQFLIGKIYCDHYNDYYNIDKAIYYLQIASNQNHPLAQAELGHIYIHEEFGRLDYKKALQYIKSKLFKRTIYS